VDLSQAALGDLSVGMNVQKKVLALMLYSRHIQCNRLVWYSGGSQFGLFDKLLCHQRPIL
jgi:hypothetical protein